MFPRFSETFQKATDYEQTKYISLVFVLIFGLWPATFHGNWKPTLWVTNKVHKLLGNLTIWNQVGKKDKE